MVDAPLHDSYRALGLDADASPAQVRDAFRRLAKAHHPDLNRGRDVNRRFIEIVRAYRNLQGARRDSLAPVELRHCGACGLLSELLLHGGDGRESCPDCLIRTMEKRRRGRVLKETILHGGVLALYAAAAALGVHLALGGKITAALLSLGCSAAGLVWLAVTCVRSERTPAD